MTQIKEIENAIRSYARNYKETNPDNENNITIIMDGIKSFRKQVSVEPVVILQKVKCKCGKEFDELPLHTCPYQEDVNNDSEFTCNCCDECRQECRDDI